MANSPITLVASSPKLRFPIEHSIVVEEKDNGFQEFTVPASIFQKIFAELTGTYFLIFLGCGSGLVNKVQPLTIVGIAIVWGLVLMVLIYALGHISGAHFNPAVSIALAAAQKFPWIHVPMYVMSQLVGATLASLTLRVLFSDQHSVSAIMTRYSSPTTDLQAFAWEFLATFVLMFTICGVATDHRASKDLSGVAVGAALLVNVMVVGPITGASLNPARSFGPAVVERIFSQLWVFIVGPVLGATTASMVYTLLRVPVPEKPDVTKVTLNHSYQQSEP